MSWQQRYLERFYLNRNGWVDGTTEFHRLCAGIIKKGAKILEIGAGPTNRTSDFLATLGELHAVDIDAEVKNNRAAVTAHVIKGERYPFADETFDACVSNYVVEHIAMPTTHLREVWRVLKSGGAYLFRTTNLFHYVTLVSALTPYGFHKAFANRLRNRTPADHDPYPTLYRLNSPRVIAQRASESGFAVEHLGLIEKEPSYGMSSRLAFVAFMFYERVVNKSDCLARLRSNLIVVLRKSDL